MLVRVLLPNDAVASVRPPGMGRGDLLVTRHAHAAAVLREVDFHKPPLPRVPLRGLRLVATSFLALDPPDHDRLRAVVAPLFTPAAVDGYRKALQALADDQLDRAPDPFDLVADFAYPYPYAFICSLTGARVEDQALLSAWTRCLVALLDVPVPRRIGDLGAVTRATVRGRVNMPRTLAAARAFGRYARRCLDETDAPAVEALRRGVADGTISDDEAVETWLLLFLAGHESTANLIANTVHALARNPEARSAVQADPSLVPAAVDEAMRRDPPVRLNVRAALRDTTVGNRPIGRGAYAFIDVAQANRDPDVVDDGERFRLGRPRTVPHLSLGLGTHFCLGAFLARAEAEIGVAAVLARAPRLELSGEPVRRQTVLIGGFDRLPLRLE
jgi:hypothetical protein